MANLVLLYDRPAWRAGSRVGHHLFIVPAPSHGFVVRTPPGGPRPAWRAGSRLGHHLLIVPAQSNGFVVRRTQGVPMPAIREPRASSVGKVAFTLIPQTHSSRSVSGGGSAPLTWPVNRYWMAIAT